MKTTVREIYDVLFAFAPREMVMGDWDNVGLLCGRFSSPVDTVLIALDPTPDVLAEAKACGAQLIVSHHPVLFELPRQINDESYEGRLLLSYLESGIAALNLHTNLDCAPGGVNDVLADRLGLAQVSVLDPAGQDRQGRDYGLLRVGTVLETGLREFAGHVQKKLACPGLRFADGGKRVCRVAVGGGSCGNAINRVIAAGCDTFVTADLKYHQFEEARFLGLNLIDAGHFETENPVCGVLARILREAFPQLCVLQAKKHADYTQFL